MEAAFLQRLQPPDFRAIAERGSFVYAYLRTDGTPYYVAIASQYRRPLSRQRSVRTPADRRRIRILRSGLPWEQACLWEQRYIARWGRKDNGTGILRNLTDGGDGSPGSPKPKTAEWRASHSATLKGRKHTAEHRARQSAALKGKTRTAEHQAKLNTPEARAKMSAKLKGHICNVAIQIAADVGIPYEIWRTMTVYERLKARAAAAGMTAREFKRLTYGRA